MATILEEDSIGEPSPPLLSSLSHTSTLLRSRSSSSPSTDHEDNQQFVILVPSLLPPEKPSNILSLWPIAPKMVEAQLGRRYPLLCVYYLLFFFFFFICVFLIIVKYQLEFIPIGLFSRIMVRCLRLCKYSHRYYWVADL